MRPILAQQSIREVTLTGRDYKQVLDAACYAVFQEGYKDGFGADGDHLKKEEDIRMALDLGFTMLTLDCSDKIDHSIENLSAAGREAKYAGLRPDVRSHYETLYLGQTFRVAGISITFDRETLIKNVLVYGSAIDFMEHVYNTYIKNADSEVDFEISIDETAAPTGPESHFFRYEGALRQRSDDLQSGAPFLRRVPKGIDTSAISNSSKKKCPSMPALRTISATS